MKLICFSAILFFVSLKNMYAQDILNTLRGDIHVHDPVMIKAGDTYYVFHTGKGISIKTSPDKIHWKNAGRIFDSSHFPAWHKTDIPITIIRIS